MFSSQSSLVTLFIALAAGVQAQSGSGVTTRYWDCCKTSCAWSGKASVTSPVKTCDISNNPLADVNAQSGCDGGSAFACANNLPWAVDSNLAYGFAAVNLAGSSESGWCCGCYQLTFTSGPVVGKTMIIQATNTGGDVGGSQFDLMIPGGGVGAFPQGCRNQYGVPSGWGAAYGGVSTRSDCDSLPAALKAGCQFRFDWFMGADNPSVNWKKVACPAAITAVTGCTRTDDGSVAPPTVSAVTSSTSPASTSSTSTTSKMVTVTVKSSSSSSAQSSTTPAKSSTTPAKSSTTPAASPSTSAASSKVSSVTTSSTSSSCASSTTPSGEVQIPWGQCGGLNWTGATTCAAGWVCKFNNPWYSQCLQA